MNMPCHQGLVLGDVEVQLEESHVLLRELNDQMEDKEARYILFTPFFKKKKTRR